MAYEYKRRRPSIIRNVWVYRRLIGTAILLGLMLWFIWANGEQVTVAFPFGLGKLTSTTGVVILLSALVGSVATLLVTTAVITIKRIRRTQSSQDQPAPQDQPRPTNLSSDRPPPDYAAKTTEGFSNANWSE
jgi:uncharacterized integral membrane protein